MGMKQVGWILDEHDAAYIVQIIGKKKAAEGIKELVEFYKKYSGKEGDLVEKTRVMNLAQQEQARILAELKEKAEEKIQIFEENLKKRESILREKEAMWLVMKKIMGGDE